MENTSVPIIVVICYIVGELYKYVFKRKKETYKLIPILMALLGGIIGVMIYLSEPSMIFNAENIYIAMMIGIVSGASATGTNQIIKQMFIKGQVNINDNND